MSEKNEDLIHQSLFLYIVNHLDKNGAYDGSALPDDPGRPYSYGAEDAALFQPDPESGNLEAAKDIYLLLKAWMQKPEQETKQLLYARIRSVSVITIFFPLAAQLRGEKLPFDLLHLAQEWLYTAADREAVKFAYLLCGLLDLEQVRRSFSENLYRDLFTMARCEEFTIFLCMACQLSDIRPQKELWYLARRTSGWGKALLMVMLRYRTPAQRQWLLKNGMELKIFWPPLAPVIIKESLLPQLLQQPEIDEDTYIYAARALVTYMMLLIPAEGMPEPRFNQPGSLPEHIPLAPLLKDLLRHAARHATTPKALLPIFAIRNRLELLFNEQIWSFLTPNEAQLLMGTCDRLIYYKDWETDIREGLFDRGGALVPEITDFAANIGIDIWPQVMEFYNAHPKDMTALRYLMFAEDWDNEKHTAVRRHLFLECAEAHVSEYLEEEEILVNLAHYLQNYPGEGSRILEACLTSIYEHARGIAALSLSRWPRTDLTDGLKSAILRALHLNDNPFIGTVLQSLLNENLPSPAERKEAN